MKLLSLALFRDQNFRHFLPFCLVAFILLNHGCNSTEKQMVKKQEIISNWSFSAVDTLHFYPAKIPGTIHTDLLEHNLIPHPFDECNEKQLQWVGNKGWVYRTSFDDVRTLPSEGWQKDQKERFVFTVLDTTNTFLFYLHVRNEIDYRYSNLYVFMETQFPNGNITRDTLECILAEPSGKWTGKGYGRLKENMILLNPTIKFPVKGAYTIDIEQAMRDENLEGITNIGIRIERNPR